jgi:dienelactone hydrolase
LGRVSLIFMKIIQRRSFTRPVILGRRVFALPLVAIILFSRQAATAAIEWDARQCLVSGRVGQAGRSTVHTDAIEAEIVSGQWRRPAEGDPIGAQSGNSTMWQAVTTNKDGWFSNAALRGGYAYVPVIVESECVMLLEAQGNNLTYVNGEPRAGDPYEYGYARLPVALRAGTNDFLFQCSRGRFKFKLVAPRLPVALDSSDTTLPDLTAGEDRDTWGAAIVVNATAETQNRLVIGASIAGGRAVETLVPAIAPFSVRKVGFRLRGKSSGSESKTSLELTLSDGTNRKDKTLDSTTSALRIRRAGQTQKRTFVSDIDGSVQYWALNPAQPVRQDGPRPALFLSLHGAGVEAIGQADAYSPKSWGHIVAPTNRRPYGFDWEGWGRMDALEVLHLAALELHPDPQRIYLTGHSMGGHGAWQLGAHFPDKFAAIGPSAGWISFLSYAGGNPFTNPTPVQAMVQRAAAIGDTLALKTNFLEAGVYILHGGADDNVPVTEARKMTNEFSQFHRDFQYHEQPGAGHWWDVSDEPGADCVDWAPLFDFFARHAMRPDESVRQINFSTCNPGVSAACHWLEIEQQVHALKLSMAAVRWDPGKRRFIGTTENIARLAFNLDHVKRGEALKVELDGQTLNKIPWPTNVNRLWLENENGNWRVAFEPSPQQKGPQRSGPFKDAFRHRMIFVYGTKGTPEENAWAFAKARFDAESFWYRGNGSIDVIPDTGFNPRVEPDRGVILFGNADSNGAWPGLLGQSPVQVRRGEIRIGERALAGENQACLFLRPRPGSQVACVGAVSGTGLTGMKLNDRLNYFLSGIEYPDCTVIGSEMLELGAPGIRAAGFFGNDWSVQNGEFAWREN